jgi:thiamine pyrophosphate-dependent acetolactate synthase large subunit-like protein
LARVYGAKGYRITEPDQLGPALTTALQDDGPSVIDIVIDPGVDYLKMRATDLVGYQYRAI